MSALIQMCDQWPENMDNGMLDIKNVFDSIDYLILLRKMKKQFGTCGAELKWFESYLTKIYQV